MFSSLTVSFVLYCRIKPAPYTTGSSNVPANNSSSSFHSSPEELAYDGPSTSSAHLAPVASSSVSYDPRKPAVKSKHLCWAQGCGFWGSWHRCYLDLGHQPRAGWPSWGVLCLAHLRPVATLGDWVGDRVVWVLFADLNVYIAKLNCGHCGLESQQDS